MSETSNNGEYPTHMPKRMPRHFHGPVTYTEIDEERENIGPRHDDGQHYALCRGLWCPCYKEGVGIAASRHLDVLDWFCKVDPDLVRERLGLVVTSG